jgi:hypothetical protein
MLYRFLPPYVGRGPGTRSRHWRGRGWRRGGSARGCPDAAAETEEFLRRDEWASGKGLVHGSTREEFPQGLRKKSERKANLAKDESAGAKQAAEKDLFLAEMPENRTSGAKAHDDCIALMSGINPGPTARTSFSAACKARLILLALSARLKPCPCYKAPWRLAAALRDAKQGIRARSPDSASLHPGLFRKCELKLGSERGRGRPHYSRSGDRRYTFSCMVVNHRFMNDYFRFFSPGRGQ